MHNSSFIVGHFNSRLVNHVFTLLYNWFRSSTSYSKNYMRANCLQFTGFWYRKSIFTFFTQYCRAKTTILKQSDFTHYRVAGIVRNTTFFL